MKHNTQSTTQNKRTSRIIKGVLASLMIASTLAATSPAFAEEIKTSTTTTVSSPLGNAYNTQVAWGGCGGNCGQ